MIQRSAIQKNDLFFSICIPQFNRTSFLLLALESFLAQSFTSFEVCISDGGSTDGRWQEISDFLEKNNLNYVFYRSDVNLKYDENLRSSINLANGKYCFLMGNDDNLIDPGVLEFINTKIVEGNYPDVIITNYKDYNLNKIIRRIRNTKSFGRGSAAAVANFRNYSFVSGVILNRFACVKYYTKIWDGVEMYQMYLGSRIVANGGEMLGLDFVAIGQNIKISGEQVDSYANKARIINCNIVSRPLPMNGIGKLVLDAIRPFLVPGTLDASVRQIYFQIFMYTYPFWIFEYRRVQSWKFSLGVCLAMSPSKIASDLDINILTKAFLWIVYLNSTIFGLIIPVFMFDWFKPFLYRLAKRGTN